MYHGVVGKFLFLGILWGSFQNIALPFTQHSCNTSGV
jgi:hypothetical protein